MTRHTLNFSGFNLPIKDTFTSDPYFKIYTKCVNGMVYRCVYESEYIRNTLNPNWETFSLHYDERSQNYTFVSESNPCKEGTKIPFKLVGHEKRAFMIEIWDHDTFSKDDFMGQIWMSCSELMKGGHFEIFEQNSENPVIVDQENSILTIQNIPNPETIINLQNKVEYLEEQIKKLRSEKGEDTSSRDSLTSEEIQILNDGVAQLKYFDQDPFDSQNRIKSEGIFSVPGSFMYKFKVLWNELDVDMRNEYFASLKLHDTNSDHESSNVYLNSTSSDS